MPANIYIRNGQPAFAALGGPVWWGKGAVLEPEDDLDMVVQKAKIDYSVGLAPISAEIKDGYSVGVDGYMATVNQENDRILGVVKSRYTVCQNETAFAITKGLQEMGAEYDTAGALGNGEKAWILMRSKQHDVSISDSPIVSYILVANSHDGSMPITAGFTPVRVVCQNTLGLALPGLRYRITIRHTAGHKDKLAAAKMILESNGAYMLGLTRLRDTLAFQPLSRDKAVEMFSNFMPGDSTKMQHKRDFVVSLYDRESARTSPNRWAWLNSAVEFVDHYSGRPQNRMRLVLWGTGLAQKARAYELAVN